MAKQRLDILVYESGLAPSREMARRYILAGEVRVDGQIADKPGMQVDANAGLEVAAAAPFVSRGGEKLVHAMRQFKIEVSGKICADVGASTGGFTDCLLQNGAGKVYAIDVGYGQLAVKLRDDARVVVMERTNARYLESLPEAIELITVDASFISLRVLLPVIKNWLISGGQVVALIKPQFEAGRAEATKGGGVIKDSKVHRQVLLEVLEAAQEQGFAVLGLERSPLTGPKGNVEFLAWLALGEIDSAADLESLVDGAM